MTDNIFIDTNILVYAHDATAGDKHSRARDLFFDLWENKTGCLSVRQATSKTPTISSFLMAS